jgi:hypothetical protein
MTAIKLRADDAEDLKIVAACLQDAIVPVTELGWLPEQACFAMVLSRFRWEAPPDPETGCERINCAVRVLGVTAVQRRNLDLRDRTLLLNLLTITPSQDGLDLIFAGDSAIHLVAPSWRCLIEDLGEPWPVAAMPCHPDGTNGGR